jgi:hypothetical protein
MNPMPGGRGLCLDSTAAQTPGGAAWASTPDTSGRHDKGPVHTQNVPSVQRSTLCAVLPWPISQEPNDSLGGQCASRLSLWDTSSRPPGMPGQTTGCLSTSGVYHERMSLYSANSSRGSSQGTPWRIMLNG